MLQLKHFILKETYCVQTDQTDKDKNCGGEEKRKVIKKQHLIQFWKDL